MDRQKLVPNSAAKFVLAVNGDRDGEIYGVWKSMDDRAVRKYESYLDFILNVDAYLDSEKAVTASTIDRTFIKSISKENSFQRGSNDMDEMIFVNEKGEKATFVVQVLFRQNATWQGKVTWLENGEETSFRSTLELMKIIDEAVRGDKPLDSVATF